MEIETLEELVPETLDRALVEANNVQFAIRDWWWRLGFDFRDQLQAIIDPDLATTTSFLRQKQYRKKKLLNLIESNQEFHSKKQSKKWTNHLASSKQSELQRIRHDPAVAKDNCLCI